MKLRVVSARRYIERAPQGARAIPAHARGAPAFATPTRTHGRLHGRNSSGTSIRADLERALRVTVDRPGLMPDQLVNGRFRPAFTAWFFARNTRGHRRSGRARRTTDGRVMVGDTILAVRAWSSRAEKIKVAKKVVPYAKALAKGLAQAGPHLRSREPAPPATGKAITAAKPGGGVTRTAETSRAHHPPTLGWMIVPPRPSIPQARRRSRTPASPVSSTKAGRSAGRGRRRKPPT